MADKVPLIAANKQEIAVVARDMPDGRVLMLHALADRDGTPLGPDNPLLVAVTSAGSTGIDRSVTPPNVTGDLLSTFPVNRARACIEIQNQSTNLIQVVRDDGTGQEQTIYLLKPADDQGPGGSWRSTTFKGRVRIYGPATSAVAASED